MATKKTYGDHSIQVLDDRDYVRSRPHIYMGSITDIIEVPINKSGSDGLNLEMFDINPGYLTLVREIIDNAVDIIQLTKKGKNVKITHDDSGDNISMSVSDDSVGVPIGDNDKTGLPTPVVSFGMLKSGKNFDSDNQVGIGFNGVGGAIANFMSKTFSLEIQRDSKLVKYDWVDGLLVNSQKPKKAGKRTGTKVLFEIDSSLFAGYKLPKEFLINYVSIIANTFPDINFWFNGKKVVKNKSENTICSGDYTIDIAMGDGVISSMANSMITFRHGRHVNEVYDSVYRALQVKAGKKLTSMFKPQDLKKIIDMSVVYKNTTISCDSQNKSRVDGSVTKLDHKAFYKFVGSGIVEKILESIEQKDIKEAQKNSAKTVRYPNYEKPKRSTKKPPKTQCYIFEGLSAKSSFMTVRGFGQGCISLKGKIIGVLDNKTSKIMANDEIKTIIHALNIDISTKSFGTGGCPYDEIIICTDTDPDGGHIACLLLCFLYKFCPESIQSGMVKHLVSPLYSIQLKGEYHWFNDKDKVSEFTAGHPTAEIRYNKGLGGINVKEWPKLVDHKQQPLSHIEWDSEFISTIEDAFCADTTERKKWILS